MSAPSENRRWPETVEEAVDEMLSLMSEADRQKLRNLSEEELIGLHFGLGVLIRNRFGLWTGNQVLLDACADYEEAQGHTVLMSEDTAAMTIIRATQERLRQMP